MTAGAAPDYASGSLADVLPAVAAGMGFPGFESTLVLPAAERVLVLLVDGLGWHDLAAHAEAAPALAALQGRAIVSGFPATTAVALASLGVGRPPGAHGLVGTSFLVPEWGGLLSPLRWGSEPNPIASQPEPTVFERLAKCGVRVAAVGSGKYRASGLTQAVLRGADYVSADSPDELVRAAVEVLAGSRPALGYVYWADLDKAGHVYGPGSSQWLEQLQCVDSIVARLIEKLPAGAVLHVTADHGMVDTDGTAEIRIDGELLQGVSYVGGEPRARHLYTQPGASDEVLASWRSILGDQAIVHSRDGAIESGWFGSVDADLADRIGDVVVAATGQVKLVSEVDARLSSMRGQHGSLTAQELDVPLLTAGQ